jgi:hypothetical protein
MTLQFTFKNLTYLVPELAEFMKNETKESKLLKLNKMESKHSNHSYKVINYDKNMLSNDFIPTYGLCRSIIVNAENDIVGFAPPKSISSESFITNYSLQDDDIIVEEFVEGTMINVFWDPSIGVNGAWEIATRNTVGAASSFYKSKDSKTFREMFLEACKATNLVLENLNKNYCYSFVLQHPENRIVVPFKVPNLYLVALFHIDNDKEKNIKCVFAYSLDNIQKENLIQFGLQNTSVQFPKKYDTSKDYVYLIEKYASMNTSYDILGVVLYNKKTGERAKIRNPVYEQVRQLRGNQPKLQYQYLMLRHQGKVAEFLKYFSEKKYEFSEFRDQVHLFTNTLFSNYISCYIKKEKPLIEYPEQYRIHMFNLHKKYLDEFKDSKLFITSKVVKKYVNEMHPSLLMYTLNYSLRKRNVELIKCEPIME